MTTTTEAPIATTRYDAAKEVLEFGVRGRPGSSTARLERGPIRGDVYDEDFGVDEADYDGCVVIDGAILDRQTANLIVLVYEALTTDGARRAFETKPIVAIIDICWKAVR